MSKATGLSLSIGKKVFHDYNVLAEYMKSVLDEYITGSCVVDCKDLIKLLFDLNSNLVFGRNLNVYDCLIKKDYPKASTGLMKYCLEKEDMEVYSALLSVIGTITDNSKEMCQTLIKNDLNLLLIDHTIQICKDDSKVKLPKGVTVNILFEKLILIVVNIASDIQCQQTLRRCDDIKLFKITIRPFTKSKDHRTKILTLAALTFLMTEEDHFSLNYYTNIIDCYVAFIKRGVVDKNRRCDDLKITCLLTVLKSLSDIQPIKCFMLQNKPMMSLLGDLLKSVKSCDDEIELTLAVLYNLSFKHSKDTSRLDIVFNKDKFVKPFLDSENCTIKKLAEGVMTDSKLKIISRHMEIEYDIYMTYYKDDKIKMEIIADFLTVKKFTVLINDEKLEAAKRSIEKSRIMILGASLEFFQNTDCSAKFEYATELDKPIFSLILNNKYRPEELPMFNPFFEMCIDPTDDKEFQLKSSEIVMKINELFTARRGY